MRRFLVFVFFFAAGAYCAAELSADIVIQHRQRHATGHVELGADSQTAAATDAGSVRDFTFGDLDSRSMGGWLSQGTWPASGSKAEAYATQTLNVTDSFITVDSVLFTENIRTGPPPVSHVFSTATSEFSLFFDVRGGGSHGEFLLFGRAPELFELTDQDSGIMMPAQAGAVFLEPGLYQMNLRWVRSTESFGETFFADNSSFVFTSSSGFRAVPEPAAWVLLSILFAIASLRSRFLYLGARKAAAACPTVR